MKSTILLDYYGQRQDSIGFKLRRELWSVVIASKMPFKAISFYAALLDTKGFKATLKRSGRCYKGLVFTPSYRHRRNDIFHVETGVLLLSGVKGILDTKVSIIILSELFDWTLPVEDIVLHKDIKKVLRFLGSLRKDIGTLYRSYKFDHLLG